MLGPVGPVSEEPARARLAFSGGFGVEFVLRSDAADPSPGSTLPREIQLSLTRRIWACATMRGLQREAFRFWRRSRHLFFSFRVRTVWQLLT